MVAPKYEALITDRDTSVFVDHLFDLEETGAWFRF
jgi:hypothetical protein